MYSCVHLKVYGRPLASGEHLKKLYYRMKQKKYAFYLHIKYDNNIIHNTANFKILTQKLLTLKPTQHHTIF